MSRRYTDGELLHYATGSHQLKVLHATGAAFIAQVPSGAQLWLTPAEYGKLLYFSTNAKARLAASATPARAARIARPAKAAKPAKATMLARIERIEQAQAARAAEARATRAAVATERTELARVYLRDNGFDHGANAVKQYLQHNTVSTVCATRWI